MAPPQYGAKQPQLAHCLPMVGSEVAMAPVSMPAQPVVARGLPRHHPE